MKISLFIWENTRLAKLPSFGEKKVWGLKKIVFMKISIFCGKNIRLVDFPPVVKEIKGLKKFVVLKISFFNTCLVSFSPVWKKLRLNKFVVMNISIFYMGKHLFGWFSFGGKDWVCKRLKTGLKMFVVIKISFFKWKISVSYGKTFFCLVFFRREKWLRVK